MFGLKFAFCLLLLEVITAACPPKEVVSPCECLYEDNDGEGDTINCNGNQTVDLKNTLKRISDNLKPDEKHFWRLQIRSPSIVEIGDQITSDLTFNYLDFFDCEKVRRIHASAFNGTALNVKWFYFYYWSSRLNNSQISYNLLDVINSFVNVEFIYINFPLLTNQIEQKSFKSLKKLRSLYLTNITNSLNSRLLINDRAFYNLNLINYLQLNYNKINLISSQAFNFQNKTKEMFYLDLSNNELNSSSFANGWPNNINRPVWIQFWNNKITYLDKVVFKNFLDLNNRNGIASLAGNPMNCSDCRNSWFVKEKNKYGQRINRAYCNMHSKQSIFDRKFDHCL